MSDCLGRDRDKAAAGGGPNKGRTTADMGEAGDGVPPNSAKGSCEGTATVARCAASNSMNGLRHATGCGVAPVLAAKVEAVRTGTGAGAGTNVLFPPKNASNGFTATGTGTGRLVVVVTVVVTEAVGTGANGSNTKAAGAGTDGTADTNASKANGSIGRCAVEAGTNCAGGAETD